jgi:soluble lytic murein transglycosylase-like protein
MQVVNFYDNEKDLFNPKNNIEWGCNILNKCIIDNNNLKDKKKKKRRQDFTCHF